MNRCLADAGAGVALLDANGCESAWSHSTASCAADILSYADCTNSAGFCAAMDGLAACGVPGASGCSGATDTGTWYSYETGSSWYR